MNRTYTPESDPDVLDRLAAPADSSRDDFNRPRQAARCGTHLRGLIQDGDRKSAEPMAARVPRPEGRDVADPDQAPPPSLGQSTRDGQAVLGRHRAAMAAKVADPAGIVVIDDPTFPEQGKHSVGVRRQSSGAPGKRADCRCAVSVHYVAPRGHYPLAMRLHLPEGGLGDPKRLGRAHVPEDQRRPPTEGQIALESLDGIRAEGRPGGLVVADGGYGVSGPSRDGRAGPGRAGRGRHYVVGVTDEMVVFAEEPRWDEPTASTGGRPQERHRPAEGPPRPIGLKELAARTPRREVTWREGTRGPMAGRFAWPRAWPGRGRSTGRCAGAEPIRLLIEEQADGERKSAFSKLPSDTCRIRAVRPWRGRRPVELGYQQREEELGLDRHEGRSWRGFHHHACVVMSASGFLTPERRRARRGRSRPGKKGEAERRRSRRRRSAGRCSGCWRRSAGRTARTADPGSPAAKPN